MPIAHEELRRVVYKVQPKIGSRWEFEDENLSVFRFPADTSSGRRWRNLSPAVRSFID